MQPRKTAIILVSAVLFIGLFVVYWYSVLGPMYEEQHRTEQYLKKLQYEKQAELEQQRQQAEIAQQQQAELERQRQQANLVRQREEMVRRQREIEQQRQGAKFAKPQPQQIAPKEQARDSARVRKQIFLNDCFKSAYENYKEAWANECRHRNELMDCRLPMRTVNLLDSRHERAKNDCYRRADRL